MTAESQFQIDCAFPGGNIVLERIEEDSVFLRQDLRDTQGEWFYWCFRVKGAQGKNLTFHFTRGNVVGVRGPAVSRDGGDSWEWLGPNEMCDSSFHYSFGANENDVRFSFGMPYQEERLRRFLGDYADNSHLRKEELCRSRKGRSVELLRLGCVSAEPKARAVLTCRHHACEMMAGYVIEGVIEKILSDSEAGTWLRGNVEFAIVPFVDKDGVEDGDQGKNRRPHDHNRDYRDSSIYPEVMVIRKLVSQWTNCLVALDVHCPFIRGRVHEVLISPDRLKEGGNWDRTQELLVALEAVQQGPLKFRLSDSQEFTTWSGPDGDSGPLVGSFATWVQSVPGVQIGTNLEIPYANAGGQEVNQDSARLFGNDLGEALYVWLRSKTARWESVARDRNARLTRSSQ